MRRDWGALPAKVGAADTARLKKGLGNHLNELMQVRRLGFQTLQQGLDGAQQFNSQVTNTIRSLGQSSAGMPPEEGGLRALGGAGKGIGWGVDRVRATPRARRLAQQEHGLMKFPKRKPKNRRGGAVHAKPEALEFGGRQDPSEWDNIEGWWDTYHVRVPWKH